MPKVAFYDMSRAEAEVLLRRYVAARPARLSWLREWTGLELEPDRGSLLDLWAWILSWDAKRGYERPTDQELPIWWSHLSERDRSTPIPPVEASWSAFHERKASLFHGQRQRHAHGNAGNGVEPAAGLRGGRQP